MTNTTHTSTAAKALAAAAAFITSHPDLPLPYATLSASGRIDMNYFLAIEHGDDPAAQKATAAAIIRSVDATWTKGANAKDATYQTTHGLLDFYVSVRREAVCERVVVGIEEVVIPATEAVAAQPERTETRELVEWRCLPVLAEGVAA